MYVRFCGLGLSRERRLRGSLEKTAILAQKRKYGMDPALQVEPCLFPQ